MKNGRLPVFGGTVSFFEAFLLPGNQVHILYIAMTGVFYMGMILASGQDLCYSASKQRHNAGAVGPSVFPAK